MVILELKQWASSKCHRIYTYVGSPKLVLNADITSSIYRNIVLTLFFQMALVSIWKIMGSHKMFNIITRW